MNPKRFWRSARGFVFLSVIAIPSMAAAQPAPLAAAGKSFGTALAKEAAGCKEKLTGINVQSVRAVVSCLLGAVRTAAKHALLDLVKNLFDEAIGLLRKSGAAAKPKLVALAQKVIVAVPAARPVITPVLAGVGVGGEALSAEAAKCREELTSLDLASVKATFQCLGRALKGAVKTAGVAVLHGLFDQFIGLLERGCTKAMGKLVELSRKVAGVLPSARGLLDPAIRAIRSGCAGAVERVAQARPR